MNIKLSKNAELVIDITDQMMKDYKECGELAEGAPGADGKNCDECLLNLEGFDMCLCEMGVVTVELERRIAYAAGNGNK